jgi:hypothetical protein
MYKFKCLVAVVGWFVMAQPSLADDRLDYAQTCRIEFGVFDRPHGQNAKAI